MKRAIFLDRDGVLCKDKNLFYKGSPIVKPEQFEWEDGAKEGLHILSKLDEFLLFLVTNQSVLSTGDLTIEEFHMINSPIYKELKSYGREFDGVYFCPHPRDGGCACRKPRIGMLLRAEKELSIGLKSSYIIGDGTSDIEMGRRVGCKTILVKTGYGGRDGSYLINPDFVEDSLFEAGNLIRKLER